MQLPEHDNAARHKRALRAELRSRRRRLSPAERAGASAEAAAFATALPHWAPGACIAAYLADDGEIDPSPLLQSAARDGLRIVLPTINTDRTLSFRHWRPGQPLVNNRFGIAEPAPDAPQCALEQIDILILPLVAWDQGGGRLGMGGGYYDRTLGAGKAAAQEPPMHPRSGATGGAAGPRRLPRCLCGLGYSWQEVEQLPREPWDVPLDMVLSERGLQQLGATTASTARNTPSGRQ
jgi:5-formyltetrahydrofolate cyclo-ligase